MSRQDILSEVKDTMDSYLLPGLPVVRLMNSEMTALKLRYLQAVEEICLKQLFATPIGVEAVMGLKPRMAKVMLKRLLDMGLLERPYRGCYRLADEGRKILKEASGGFFENGSSYSGRRERS